MTMSSGLDVVVDEPRGRLTCVGAVPAPPRDVARGDSYFSALASFATICTSAFSEGPW
jgi:hypothetical protein